VTRPVELNQKVQQIMSPRMNENAIFL
jgi:hypothetical protein